MKYTSLFSAVAIAAAMGTQALATVTTNTVPANSINFEGASYPVGTMQAAQLTGWTVQNEDLSEIIYAPLSSADAVDGYTANKHVKLNTEGNELKWEPSNMTTNKAIIEMKVRLVASDTAPAISDNDVHAAVYLQVSDPVDATKDGLYAYSRVSGEDKWSKLDTSEFNHNLATGDMVALRVVMDYAERTATYEGALLADAENDIPVYRVLGSTAMANPASAATQGQLASISFKGTGGIDDLFVGEIVTTPSSASVTFELWSDLTAATADEALDPQTIDTVAAGSAVTASFETDLEGETLTFKLYDVTAGTPGTECTWLVEPTADGEGNYNVTMSNFAFAVDHNYLVKVIVGAQEEELDAFAIGDADTQAALATAGVAPVEVDGDYFIVNVIEPAGATASLLGSSTLDGEFSAVSATRTEKTGYTELKYAIPANETAKFFKVKFTK